MRAGRPRTCHVAMGRGVCQNHVRGERHEEPEELAAMTQMRWACFVAVLWMGYVGRVSVAQDAPRATISESTEDPVGEDELFSGPQPGERLSPFLVREVLGPRAGQETDLVSQAEDRPIVLVFVHDVNRQSISMTRALTRYTHRRAADGLVSGVIFMDDDLSAAEATVKRIQHALTAEVPTGVSVDGREGPGSYGLNRHVMLTILVAKDQTVAANFALVQPSLKVDLPKILESIVRVAGGEMPRIEELTEMGDAAPARRMASEAPDLRPLMTPVIQRDASDEAIDRAAKEVDERVAQDPAVRKEVYRIATTIVGSGKLANYGTPRSQHHLQRWAKELGDSSADERGEKREQRESSEQETDPKNEREDKSTKRSSS